MEIVIVKLESIYKGKKKKKKKITANVKKDYCKCESFLIDVSVEIV